MAERLSPEKLSHTYERVRKSLCTALGDDDLECTPESLLVRDLGAEEIDLLDIVFLLEKDFGISIRTNAGLFRLENLDNLAIQHLLDYVVAEQVRTGELVVETEMLRFFMRPDGRVHVAMSLEDGSWGYADGSRSFPSHLVLLQPGRWAAILKELEDLINDPKVTEQALQSFLEQHPELLKGDDYDLVVPQAALSPVDFDTEWYMDFVARPVDANAFSKIVELKKPQIPLMKRTRFSQNPFSAQLYDALQQLRRYSRAFTAPNVRDDFRQAHGIDVYRPDLHLIAGRAWDIALADRFRDFVKDEQVFVEDWDSALRRLRRKFT